MFTIQLISKWLWSLLIYSSFKTLPDFEDDWFAFPKSVFLRSLLILSAIDEVSPDKIEV